VITKTYVHKIVLLAILTLSLGSVARAQEPDTRDEMPILEDEALGTTSSQEQAPEEAVPQDSGTAGLGSYGGQETAPEEVDHQKNKRSESEVPSPPMASAPASSLRTLSERRKDNQMHKWSVGVNFSRDAYRLADWRAAPTTLAKIRSPRFLSLLLQVEKPFFYEWGVWSAYADAGVAGNMKKDGFDHLAPAMYILGLGGSYRARFIPRQWVVPYVRGGAEGLRYAYHFSNNRIHGYRVMPRLEGGLELFLNILDPSSAGEMYGNYSATRSYLGVGYSITNDSSKKDFNLSDRALRFSIRVEF
jgi:hypothetical protein